jgi:DNA-binding MarR family transcriptional regulator
MKSYLNSEMLRDAAQLRQDVMALVRRLRQQTEGGELPVSHMFLLSRIERLGDAAIPSVLAAQEGLRPSNLSAALTALEAQGYVRREPDAGDKRRVVVRLTAHGTSMLERDRAGREQWLASALAACLDQQELAQLRQAGELLQRLSRWNGPGAAQADHG